MEPSMKHTPKKIAISRLDIVQSEIKFPSGKTISLHRNKPYLTHDPEEINFASQLKGISVVDLDDKEFRTYIGSNFVPSITNPGVNEENADEFRWLADREEEVAEELRKRGYIVTSPEDDGEAELDELKDKARELGIKAYGNMKRKTLEARIAKAEGEE